MLLLLEESPFLWSPIILSMVKPDPFDRIVDFVIEAFDDAIVLDIKSSCFEDVKHEENGDK